MYAVKEIAGRRGVTEDGVRKAVRKLVMAGVIRPRKGRDWSFGDDELDAIMGAMVGRGKGRKGRVSIKREEINRNTPDEILF